MSTFLILLGMLVVTLVCLWLLAWVPFLLLGFDEPATWYERVFGIALMIIVATLWWFTVGSNIKIDFSVN